MAAWSWSALQVELDDHDGHVLLRERAQVVDARELETASSMRSVTCVSISSGPAPGVDGRDTDDGELDLREEVGLQPREAEDAQHQ
jgi:hypothetical protein